MAGWLAGWRKDGRKEGRKAARKRKEDVPLIKTGKKHGNKINAR